MRDGSDWDPDRVRPLPPKPEPITVRFQPLPRKSRPRVRRTEGRDSEVPGAGVEWEDRARSVPERKRDEGRGGNGYQGGSCRGTSTDSNETKGLGPERDPGTTGLGRRRGATPTSMWTKKLPTDHLSVKWGPWDTVDPPGRSGKTTGPLGPEGRPTRDSPPRTTWDLPPLLFPAGPV